MEKNNAMSYIVLFSELVKLADRMIENGASEYMMRYSLRSARAEISRWNQGIRPMVSLLPLVLERLVSDMIAEADRLGDGDDLCTRDQLCVRSAIEMLGKNGK